MKKVLFILLFIICAISCGRQTFCNPCYCRTYYDNLTEYTRCHSYEDAYSLATYRVQRWGNLLLDEYECGCDCGYCREIARVYYYHHSMEDVVYWILNKGFIWY